MKRLQKKCVIVSSAFHALLIGILLFGAALVPSRETTDHPLITMYSSAAVIDTLSRGGNPEIKVAQPPSPEPVVPKPEPVKPAPQPTREPEPKPEPPKARPEPPKQQHQEEAEDIPTAKSSDAAERPVVKPKTEHKVVIDKDSLKPRVRKPSDRSRANEEAEAAEAKAKADRRRKAQELASAVKTLSQNFSSSSLVQMPSLDGTAGEMSVNYSDLIISKYYNAWITPMGLDDNAPVTVASVTISRDGNVINTRIIKSSGNAAMDKSVLKVLQTVTFIEPFPASFKEQERTVTIKFNLQAKRGTG